MLIAPVREGRGASEWQRQKAKGWGRERDKKGRGRICEQRVEGGERGCMNERGGEGERKGEKGSMNCIFYAGEG